MENGAAHSWNYEFKGFDFRNLLSVVTDDDFEKV